MKEITLETVVSALTVDLIGDFVIMPSVSERLLHGPEGNLGLSTFWLELDPSKIPAAVSIIVREASDGGAEILFVKKEQGFWTFPGGHLKDEETHEDAARRETGEEIGVHNLDFLRTLAMLPPVSHKSSFFPYVMLAEGPLDIRPDGEEIVDSCFVSVADIVAVRNTKYFAACRQLPPYNQVRLGQVSIGDSVALVTWAMALKIDPSKLLEIEDEKK